MGAGGGAFGGMGARGQLGSPSPSAPNFGVGAGPAARPAAAIACREHPDERVQYFCHTCETPAVCAECVIHGVHKEHDVQQLRRAYPVIKSKVEDFLFTVGSRIEELAAVESRIEAHRRELANAVMAAKQQMGKAFEEVRQRLAKKEMELMQNADAFLHESHSELEGHLRTAREKTRGLEETSSKIRSHINTSDEVGLLNYYADVKGFLQSTLATTDHQQLANLPEAAARRVLANINHTNDHIEALQQLHSAISNLRSLEPSDGQQPQSLGAGGGMQQERGLTGGGGGGLGYSDRPLSGGGGQRRPYDAY
uniref:B box-type domain-containing protein n=1 Tax=Chromera velia CCMP2878 TaxID=1169474 RepID=A0A0G4I0T8_9ALVE|eukprot:Cvel_9984.t1-p1 / transcript=Cvel_9984.t1 / gene=Cvel_9984 / organism=Chromera_velia_CCMP2878 / gene_product=Tripartite motif-containing protein 54, putative / transcript_product=Tripartite motif-containing protein 54, putative / location=Cvel_scaffold591:38-4633(+) / protein_length=309 / sequence_SO=supercontig / SO=protein_coding / is_pseudo=false